ncbi:MAG: tetratricopeptide repeat protein, partial [Persicimonas sp.]
MNFEERARKARRRGDPVRAAVVLIEGLKRHPSQTSALDLLSELFVEDIDSPGLGVDLAAILARQADAFARFEALLDELYLRHKDGVAREIVRAAREEGFDLQWPPPSPPIPDERQPEDESDPVEEPPEARVATSTHDEESEPPSDDESAEEADVVASEPVEPTEPEQLGFDDLEQPPGASEPDEVDAHAPPVRDVSTPHDGGREVSDEPAVPEKTDARTEEAATDDGAASRSDSKGRSRSWLIALVALAVLAGIGWWLQEAGIVAFEGLEARIERVDPIERGAIDDVFSSVVDEPAGSDAADEQIAFLEAVRAADWGEQSATVPSEETHWGVATAAVSHALQGDFEEAVARAKRLERGHPDELVTYWTAGFVEEQRGRYASAAKQYRRGRADYEEFAPLVTGQLRIALRQGRAETAQKLQVTLEEMSPEN